MNNFIILAVLDITVAIGIVVFSLWSWEVFGKKCFARGGRMVC